VVGAGGAQCEHGGRRGTDEWGRATVPAIKTDSNEIQTVLNTFKSIQSLNDPKRTFPGSKNLKQNIVLKI
jgi:hypothetical protein